MSKSFNNMEKEKLEQREAIQECYQSIIDTIDVVELSPVLFSQKIIPSVHSLERIYNTGVTKRDKATVLMHIIMKSDNPKVYQIFIDALQDPYEFLASEISTKLSALRRKKRSLQRTMALMTPINTNENKKDGKKSRHDEIQRPNGNHSHGAHSSVCKHCKSPLKPELSFEAGKLRADVCICREESNNVHKPRRLASASECNRDEYSALKQGSNFQSGLFESSITTVKQICPLPSTQCTECKTISCVEHRNHESQLFPNTSVCDVGTDVTPDDIHMIHRFTGQNQNGSLTQVKCLDTPPAAKLEKISLLGHGADTVDGHLINDEYPNLFTPVKCLDTPPAAKLENISLLGHGTDIVGHLNNAEPPKFMMHSCHAPNTLNNNIRPKSKDVENKVGYWDKKSDETKPDNLKVICDSNNLNKQVAKKKKLTRAPELVSKTENYHQVPNISAQIQSLEDNKKVSDKKEITLTRETKDDSFGFKFIPGSGRPRYNGDDNYYVTETISKNCDLTVKDSIISIDNIPIKDKTYNEVVNLFKGKVTVQLETCSYPL